MATDCFEINVRGTITIGRKGAGNVELPLDDLTISRYHAKILPARKGHFNLIKDLNSYRGTYVNGRRIRRYQRLYDGDEIRIGRFRLVYGQDKIKVFDPSFKVHLEARHLNQRFGKKVALCDVSLSVNAGEFIAIIGPSGTGKSTLLNALCGVRPASDGRVFINGVDFYKNYDLFKGQIGYVPQNDIVHADLTVEEALRYGAKLRLPADTKKASREKHIDDILKSLGIEGTRKKPIKKISGGEKKRVSIAAEFITKPALVFLDEVTSGLDPGLENLVMRSLRNLCDKGHTIIIVTHSTGSLYLCDKLACLDRKGRLVYLGPRNDALQYFRNVAYKNHWFENSRRVTVDDFDDIYTVLTKLGEVQGPKQRRSLFNSIRQKLKRLAPGLKNLMIKGGRRSWNSRAVKQSRAGFPVFRQFAILTQRNLNLLFRDTPYLLLLLLIAPVIGSLDFIFWKKGLFDIYTGDARSAITDLFMVSVICCLVGALTSMREIIRESDIFKREYMVGVRIWPYLFSKLMVSSLFAAYSAAIFIFFLHFSAAWPPASSFWQVYLVLGVSILGGAVMGLFISALSPNQNTVALLLLVILIPQLIFGGIIPANRFGPAGKYLGYATTTKWTFESLVTISGMGTKIADDPYWQLSENERLGMTDNQKAVISTTMGQLIFQSDFPGIMKYFSPVVNQTEPAKPEQLSDIPAWQQSYLGWMDGRSKSIGAAEGLITTIYKDFGQAFQVKLQLHMLAIIGIIVAFFVATAAALKLRV